MNENITVTLTRDHLGGVIEALHFALSQCADDSIAEGAADDWEHALAILEAARGA